ncbi:hypothetical protein A9R00_00615 [Oleispira antarctica]|uniref:Gluconeogenesis factor n=1 Tax=Oleispira antarctica TaxID=188908 RepID=A0A1Y5HWL9_OLEAN|nr:hypothetical protein A9R00_00615 [Oleispira antarctica]
MQSVEGAKLVCVGGGHGLGRLLSSLKEGGPNLTGIVATTDEGGSTGRLREEAETIAWGDLRNCLSQLCTLDGIGQLLFEYRFQTQGELDGHNLGNLILFALDQLSVRPTDAIRVMRDMLNIKSHLYPMADRPTTLMAKTVAQENQDANILVGELSIDDTDEEIDHLYLDPKVNAEHEVIATIEQADAIVLSAGSFMTSIMPSLLVENILQAINKSKAPLILVVNIKEEELGGDITLTFAKQLSLLEKAGVRTLDHILWPANRELSVDHFNQYPIKQIDMKPCERGLHNEQILKSAVLNLL